MKVDFIKMHGVGNDFVVIDVAAPFEPDPEQIRRLAHRRTGIGFDQALIVEPPRDSGTVAFYRIFNADGDEVEQCGNGARCIASLMSSRAKTGEQGEIVLGSAGGHIRAHTLADGRVSVAMGVPNFDPASLPFEATTESYIYTIEAAGTQVEIGAVSIGNPHAVITVSSVAGAPVDRLGPAIECHEAFPNRTNVGFMEVVDAGHIRLRVHERGTGETLACGTGACAAVAVGRRHGVLTDTVIAELPGGSLEVRWAGPGEPIWLTGPAEQVFEGQVEL